MSTEPEYAAGPARDDATDPLAAIAVLDAPELVVRPLREISARAAHLRTARRARGSVLAAASVVLVTTAVSLMGGGGTAASPSTSASPTAPSCDTVGTFPVGSRPALVHLMTSAAAGRLAYVEGTDGAPPECTGRPWPPVAAVLARFAADGGSVEAGLVVSGPATAEPLGLGPTEQPAQTVVPTPADDARDTITEQVTVHGAAARLDAATAGTRVLLAPGTATLEWREPSSGQWWLVRSAGLSNEDLVRTVEGLVTGDDGLDPATLPPAGDGWTQLPVVDPAAQGHRFDAVYLAADGSVGGLTLSVSDVPMSGPEVLGQVTPGAVRFADVHGARAMLRPIGVDGDSPSLVWSADGLHFLIQAGPERSFDDLVALARSVRAVPADDPRVVAAAAAAPVRTSEPPPPVPTGDNGAPLPSGVTPTSSVTGTESATATPAPTSQQAQEQTPLPTPSGPTGTGTVSASDTQPPGETPRPTTTTPTG